MRRLFAAFALLTLVTTGCAQNDVTNGRPTVAAARPWEPAVASLIAARNDISKAGLPALQPRLPELESALADAGKAYAAAPASGETGYILVDGTADSILAIAAIAKRPDGPKTSIQTVGSPYPVIALMLGVYYNEVGRSEDALRVLDLGLALPTIAGSVGEHHSLLVCERGASLAKLKRWPDSLAAYDGGLTSRPLADKDRARMLRGRGMALTELGRLDEAEQSYQESLKAEPGNRLALSELKYISQLRAGRSALAPNLFIPGQTAPH